MPGTNPYLARLPIGRSGAARAGLAVLVALASLLTAGRSAAAEPSWKKLSEREVRYLEMTLAHVRRLQGNFDQPGRQPLAAGALAAAALAAEGGPEAARRREEAANWVARVLDACPKWTSNDCARSQLSLQRVALQYPEVLPPEILDRLRQEVTAAAPPPNPSLIQDPWSFSDTENQRMIVLARSLVAQAVAGTPGSAASRGWGTFAREFLEAHDRDGWYEAESPGYLALSVNGLLQLADHAPQQVVRDLAKRQLDVIFTHWAQSQVGGYPAGPKSRTNGNWALSRGSSPWQAWGWLAVGLGNPAEINFLDRPELAVSRYRIPDGAIRLLAERRQQKPYEILVRRRIDPAKRRAVDTALYSYATPDYVLGVAQSVDNLALRVSGGQEIVATLYAESPQFAPLYLWSRTKLPHGNAAEELNTRDQAAASRNLVVARLNTPGAGIGHAYLSPPWSRPEVMGDVVVSRCGDTYVALVTSGGWEVAPALEKFPAYYGAGKKRRKDLAGAWVAVPRAQPASVGMQVGRQAEDGEFAAWKKKAAGARLAVGGAGEIRFTAGGGGSLDFDPGRRASASGKAIEAAAYPRLRSPFLKVGPSPGPPLPRRGGGKEVGKGSERG